MSRNWNEINMVDACEILTCGVASTPKYVDEKNGIPFLSAQNVKNGEIILDKYKYISQEFHEHLTKKNKPKKGDILYSRVGAKYGEAAVIEHDFEFSVYVSVTLIRPKPDLFDNYYFKYYLNSPRIKDLAKKSIQSSGVPNLNVNVVREFPIPIPSLLEQKQIVEILDKTFESIEQAKINIEKNIENTKELFQSRLNEIFSQKGDGWEEKTLKEIAIVFGRGKSKHRPRNHESLFGGKYPFIQTGDVRNANKYVKNYTQTYSEIGLSQSKLWSKNTICITIAANIAETAILDFDSCFPDSIIGLQVDESKATVDFTYYVLQYLKENLKLLGKGSAQDNINLGTFENEYFPFPKIEEQKKIVLELDKLSEQTKQLEKHYKQKLKNLEELKKSILQKAFSGELLK